MEVITIAMIIIAILVGGLSRLIPDDIAKKIGDKIF